MEPVSSRFSSRCFSCLRALSCAPFSAASAASSCPPTVHASLSQRSPDEACCLGCRGWGVGSCVPSRVSSVQCRGVSGVSLGSMV
eukprot:1561928-Rhodomonas_salina.1